MKKKISFLIHFLTLTVIAQTPILNYTLDDLNFNNTASNVSHLTMVGNSIVSTTDRHNNDSKAIKLTDGFLTTSPSLKNSSYTISVFIKTSTNNTNIGYVFDFLKNYGPRMYLKEGKINAVVNFGTQSPGSSAFSAANAMNKESHVIADDQWHHIAITGKGTINPNNHRTTFVTKFYIDGVLIETTTKQSTSATQEVRGFNTGAKLNLGINQHQNNYTYNDEMDDFSIYATDLSATQINAIANQRIAKTIYVDASATGNNDGNSWSDAYTSLKDATDFATVNGDEIWIAKGTYTPDASDRTASFNIKADISLYGGFLGTETQVEQRDFKVNKTIVSGDLNANDDANINFVNTTRDDNSFNIIVLDAVAKNVVLDGFTISGGHATATNSSDPANHKKGAAIYKGSDGINLTLSNLEVKNNITSGGGVINLDLTKNSTITLQSSSINNNLARYATGVTIGVTTGGVCNVNFYNSLFYNNVVDDMGGSRGFSGSSFGFFVSDATINSNIINNTFVNNKDFGTKSGNENDKGTIVLRRLKDDSLNVINADFHNNNFYQNYDSPNVVATNTIGLINRPANKINSINFTHNNSNHVSKLSSRVTNLITSNNIDVDPEFVDIAADDYKIKGTSAIINVGDNSKVPQNITKDLKGDDRIQETTVDLGVYETLKTVLSVNDFELNSSVVLYPNPVRNNLHIKVNQEIELVTVYNLLGKSVLTTKAKTINTTTLKKGVYILQIETKKGLISKRFVKK